MHIVRCLTSGKVRESRVSLSCSCQLNRQTFTKNCGFSPSPMPFFNRLVRLPNAPNIFLITLLSGWMRPLHNFRTGPLPSNDHPAFNAAGERDAFLHAFRERGQNLCRIHCLLWLTHSPRRGISHSPTRGSPRARIHELRQLDRYSIRELFTEPPKLFER